MLVESYDDLMQGDPSPECEGFLHSVETCGTVDGPGIRFVLFTTGCPLRCLYCHNPDSQRLKAGRKVTAGEMVEQIRRYRPFIKNGGLTISGGEPLAQQRFIESVFRDVKRMGLHTALDTSGCFGTRIRPHLLDEVDLVLLDLKSWTNARHRRITGQAMDEVLAFAPTSRQSGNQPGSASCWFPDSPMTTRRWTASGPLRAPCAMLISSKSYPSTNTAKANTNDCSKDTS